MGPIEIVFIVLMAVFGAVGIVRGYAKELGVTALLLLALFVMELIDERYRQQFETFLALFAGPDPLAQMQWRAVLFCIFLIVIAFITYQGETIAFAGKVQGLFFNLGSGLLNGYLLVGSIWYYLHTAGWPILHITGPYTSFYLRVVQLLPPAIFGWPVLVGLAVFMLILRVWK